MIFIMRWGEPLTSWWKPPRSQQNDFLFHVHRKWVYDEQWPCNTLSSCLKVGKINMFHTIFHWVLQTVYVGALLPIHKIPKGKCSNLCNNDKKSNDVGYLKYWKCKLNGDKRIKAYPLHWQSRLEFIPSFLGHQCFSVRSTTVSMRLCQLVW